ncbi:hypothetical protein ACIPRI_01370 [Variovorax sp. LARHSF232]
MPSPIALLGAARSGRHALADALAPRLQSTLLRAEVIEDAAALAALQKPALVLLLAPCDSTGEAEDLQWRQHLMQSGIGFSVLHGDAEARLVSAWHLIQALLGLPPAESATQTTGKPWRWNCDKCSDPACEHRLFRDLLDKKLDQGTEPAP